jgi:hypothetical protein
MPPPMVCSVRRVWLVWFRLGRVEGGVASLTAGIEKDWQKLVVSGWVRDFASGTGIACCGPVCWGRIDAMSQ